MSARASTFLPPLKDQQGAASDPLRSVWLSASAGTGKTQVLAARVYRLLLRGVEPGCILCLTFTKAGAAEMAGRVNATLARWVRADDAALSADLRALGEDFGPEQRRRARTLFAKVLDAPGGGLRIQTIHSFCQSLLAGFPVEAGLVPGFRPLDAREEAGLAREALADLLVEEEAAGRRTLVDAIGALSLRLGEGGAEAFLLACARAPDAMEALPSGIAPWLRRALDLPSEDIAAHVAERCSNGLFDCAGLRTLIDANRQWGTATGTDHATIGERWLAASPEDRVGQLAALSGIFLTGKGEPRKASAKLVALLPDYAERAAEVAAECTELLGMIARAGYADLLAGAFDAGRAYARSYRAAKRRLGAVDFDDLIRATVDLLAQPGMGDWVRYKLDQATDHILIDEAQDTNPQQWAIVRAIADEFFAGEGAHADVTRTLFTVGDYKQAIFGFQGTSPLYFEAAHRHFTNQSIAEDAFGAVAPRLGTLALTASFRSTRPVLEFVDAAIEALPPPALGTATERHDSEVPGPGSVTLWPLVTAGVTDGDDAGEEGWIDDATRALAGRIAKAIKGWIGTLPLDSKGRTLRPEDVMVLVKRRGELASLIVARLYAEGVPVAGVDRLRLNAPLAVQDLLAAVRFVLQPDDDLTLASLLVSPLIGWSQDELMAAAIREGRRSLWRHLRDTQDEARLAPLRGLLARADFTTPYRFIEEILSGAMDGRRKLLERLGEEARDPIEELLGAALNFEATTTPSLQRFLDWFDRGDVEIVRDPSAPLDAIRVMTAHGAKGLQAPLVILADATADPANARRDIVKWPIDGVELPVFRPRAAERAGSPLDPVLAAADARELEEHWRLFYVAATRAEERLVVAGALGSRPLSANSWYAASAAALDTLGVAAADEGGERCFTGATPAAPVAAEPRSDSVVEPVRLPAWAREPAPEEARPPRPLAPSSIGEDEVADPPPSAAMRAAAERGRLLHALFERLPALDPDRRYAAALRWLEVSGGVDDERTRDEIARAACAILSDPKHREIFAPAALAEAPIAATVGGAVIAGTVDRLVVTPTRVRVIDFKTGRRVPAALEDIPVYHLRQMAAYAAALRVVFPGRAVEAALLYTAAPRLFDLSDDLLEAHKPRLAATEQS
ncbi:double-strand break repair helicase AddA [uncultured Sphingomonas sp.]|uniref:double-strand break repair helicase AddA n=1 Tax=uncultured Sphingomonas sp. TaxID=158754 RepID=UPI0025EB3D9E|nr:double-strand break repair helicase AddA [uncultured Sphingomonas sp.]